MRSKAYVKKQNLPNAPAPTLPVRVETDSENSCKMSLECITDKQREMAYKSRNEHLENAWTYEEIKKLKQLHRSGISRREIAEYFPNRSRDAVGCKLRNLIKKGDYEKRSIIYQFCPYGLRY